MDEEKVDKITDFFNNILGEHGKAIPVNGNDFNELCNYMATPVIELRISRIGCNIQISNCKEDEVEGFIADGIGRLLNLIPENRRNDILVKAINIPESKEGELYEEDDDNEE